MVVRAHLERRFGEAALVLAAGDLDATFLPACGMLGVSFRHRGDELLALPHSVRAWRAGATTGLPLLHPWANRLARRMYVADGRAVDLTDVTVPVDGNGRPIHGTVRATPFTIRSITTDGTAAVARVALHSTDDPLLSRAFPFAHDLEITVSLDARAMEITTSLTALGHDAVPVSFGWHPYLTMPGARRHDLTLRLPACDEIELGAERLPTDNRHARPAGADPIGARTFDNLYALGDDRRFVLQGGGRELTVTFDGHYGHAQLYAPPRATFVCIEPMTAPVGALSTGATPFVEPGSSYSATFTVAIR